MQIGRHDRDIDVLHGLHEQNAHPWPLEYGFGDDRKCNYRAKLQPDDGNHRYEGVLQRVTEMYGPGCQAAGAGEADIVGAQHLEHLGAHQPHDQGHLEQAQCDRRHDQGLEPGNGEQSRAPPADPHHLAAAERRQPAESDGEKVNQQDADQEGRQRDSDQRDRLEQFRQQRVAPQRRINAHQDAEHRCEDGGANREFQRRRHPFLQEVRDRLAELVGDAEFELHRVAEIARELHRHGIVEAERFPDRRALGGRGVDRDHLVDRIAGEAEHRKRDDADGDHDAYRLHRPAQSESEHVVLSLPC